MIKTLFTLPSIAREVETLTYFCKTSGTDWDWSEIVFKNHPQLEKDLVHVRRNQWNIVIRTYTKHFITAPENKQRLTRLVPEYQRTWDRINDTYISILTQHLETKLPTRRKTMKAYVSIVPIFPRNLDTWSFNVSSRNTSILIPITMHEILHFFYFKKWMEVFPKTKRKELDAPHLVWVLSEILDPIILNNNPDIQALHPYTHEHYREFQALKIGGVSVTKRYEKMYKKYLRNSESFESFLKACWSDISQHKEIFNLR